MDRVYISTRVSADLRREVDRAYLGAAQQLGRKYSLNEPLCDVLRIGLPTPK